MLNEADTKAKLIEPMLRDSGWKEAKITREQYITPGRLIDENGNREKGKRPDYILFYSNNLEIAVVEAKDEGKSHLDGLGQAKDYAQSLGVLFAYSTNGHKIEEFDHTTNTQTTLDKFPTPEELYERYKQHKFGESFEPEPNPLTYPYHYISGGKYPRYFQDAAVRKAIESIMNGNKRVLLTMATGSGKTYVAFQLVWKLIKSGYLPNQRVLYLADRIFLRNQAYNEFAPFEDGRGIIEEGKAPKNRDVYFSIYQSMYSGDEKKRLFQEYPPDYFDLIVIDECHRSGYGTWREILDYFGDAVHLGMTATPKTDDNINTYDYFGKPVYVYSMGQAIEDGFLAPFRIHRSFTNIDRNGLNIQDALYQGAQAYIPEEIDLKDIYTLESFEREIVLPDRTREICEHLAEQLRTFNPYERTIVFCVNNEHAVQVAKELQNRFAHLGYSDYAVRIVSDERNVNKLYEQFRNSEQKTPVVATTVDLLTTGVDIPSVHNLVFLKPMRSKVYFKQHIGRGCRIDPITNKYFFRIMDYVNATRLLDDWDTPGGGKATDIVQGPFDLKLNGVLVHNENQTPISDARIVAQLGPNMQRNVRTDENGKFTLEELPHSPITIHVKKSGFKSRQLTITPSETSKEIVIELRPEQPVRKKIELEGVEVHIAEETKITLTVDGKTLTDAEYIEYSEEGVKKRVANLQDLYHVWTNTEERQKFLENLRDESIYPDLLASILERPDADAFDVIAHIAFGAPILTRDERANAFINKKSEFLDAFGDKAQEAILTLLEKYKIGGVEQITKPEVFRVPPFDKMGYLHGVAEIFGGFEELKKAINTVELGLYSEEVLDE